MQSPTDISFINRAELNPIFRFLLLLRRFILSFSWVDQLLVDTYYGSVLGFALRRQGAGITDTAIREWMYVKPENAEGMMALKKTLSELGVKAKFMKLANVSSESISALSHSSVLCLNDGRIVNCIRVTEKKILLHFGEGKTKSLRFEDLASVWGGVLIQLDVSNAVTYNNYQEERSKELWRTSRLPLSGLAAVSVVAVAFSNGISEAGADKALLWCAFTIINIVGFITSFLLVKFYLFGENALPKFCRSEDNQASNTCGKVLQSNNSTMFGIPHADLGVTFFLGNVAVLSAFGVESVLFLLGSLIGVGYSCFSVYYQAIVVKSWCKLCLIVQGLVAIQFVFVMMFLDALVVVSSQSFIEVKQVTSELAIFVAVTMGWTFVRSMIEVEKSRDLLGFLYAKHVFDSKQFVAQMSAARTISIQPMESLLPLESNLPNPTIITIVMSSHCRQCASTYKDFLALHESGQWALDINITLYDSRPKDSDGIVEDDSDHKTRKVSRRVTALILAGETQQAIKSLGDWYGRSDLTDYEGWLSRQRPFSDQELKDAGGAMNQISDWAKEQEINHFPIVAIGERIIPEVYLSHESALLRRVLPVSKV